NADANEPIAFFSDRQNGVQTNRDVWVYNFSKPTLEKNVETTISFYNDQVDLHATACRAAKNPEAEAKKRISEDNKKIKWTGSLISKLMQNSKTEFEAAKIGEAIYRPFCKLLLYYDRHLNHRYKERLFPTVHHPNVLISTV